MPDEYASVLLAIDPVILTIRNKELCVLLKKREKEPYTGKHELLGGRVKKDETAEAAAARKVREIVGDAPIYLEQFHTFTEPGRDPRERSVSVAFVALVPAHALKLEGTGAWFPIGKLPALAFDHARIIAVARDYLRAHTDEIVVKQFLPKRFPLNELQAAYECIKGETYDNRNFRKRMLALELVTETEEYEKGVSHRPARLYTFAK